jgi:hypothetical protein
VFVIVVVVVLAFVVGGAIATSVFVIVVVVGKNTDSKNRTRSNKISFARNAALCASFPNTATEQGALALRAALQIRICTGWPVWEVTLLIKIVTSKLLTLSKHTYPNTDTCVVVLPHHHHRP